MRSYGHGGGKGATGNTEAAFLAQSTLTPEELDGILKVPNDTAVAGLFLWTPARGTTELGVLLALRPKRSFREALRHAPMLISVPFLAQLTPLRFEASVFSPSSAPDPMQNSICSPFPSGLAWGYRCNAATRQEELVKSRKWSARHRNAEDKICRVWEERGADYARLQQKYEEAEEARQKKALQRREMEVAQVNLASPSPASPLLVVLFYHAVF